MPQLDPTWFASQLFWLLITFGVLYVILSKWMLPPLQEILTRRQQTREGDIGRAQSLKSEAEKMQAEYERLQAETRSKAQALLAEAQEAHKAKAERAAQEMDRQIEKKLAEANANISAKKQELMDALTPATEELAALIVEKLTSRAPSSDQVGRVVNALGKTGTR